MPTGSEVTMAGEQGQVLRVLVVDDHTDSANVVVRLLVRQGIHATAAEGYETALAAAQTQAFDLMICDIGMPDRDGYQLLAAMRALRPIRAFAMTGLAAATDIAKISAAGFDDFFLKPFHVESLMTAIARVAAEIDAERRAEAVTRQPAR